MYEKYIKPNWKETKLNINSVSKKFDSNEDSEKKHDAFDRFFRFTSKYTLSNSDYGLQVFTKDNDVYNFHNYDICSKEITIVIVKKCFNSIEYVDVNNNYIELNKLNKCNLIYTSMMNVDSLTVDRVKEIYMIDNSITNEEIEQDIDKHKIFLDDIRNKIANNPKAVIILDIIKVLPGLRKPEQNIDGTFKINPVEGRIIEDKPNWRDLRSVINPQMNIHLRIEGKYSVYPEVDPESPYMEEYQSFTNIDGEEYKSHNSKVTPVFSRPMSESEQDLFFGAIYRIYYLTNKKDRKKYITKTHFVENNVFYYVEYMNHNLKKVDIEEMDLIEKWLNGVCKWGKPENEKLSEHHIWIENRLYIYNQSIPPSLSKIKFLSKIKLILKHPIFHVNAEQLSKNNQFVDIKYVNGKIVEDTHFDTYEQYLLATRHDGNYPPLYTPLPRYDSCFPLLRNPLIVWKFPFSTTGSDQSDDGSEVDDILDNDYHKDWSNIEEAVDNAFVIGEHIVTYFNKQKFWVKGNKLTPKIRYNLRMNIIRNYRSNELSEFDGY